MKLVPLQVTSKEFEEVAQHITKSYPNACIMFIEKVEGHSVEQAYEALKKTMPEPNERLLFHGTTEGNAMAILEDGFNPQKNVRSAYGVGTYFAANASLSKDYTQVSKRTIGFELCHMLVCSVLVGQMIVGANNSKVHNANSYVDNSSNPKIFVIPTKEQAIPRYFIAFHKDIGA
jgi:hypothetical protein